MNDNLLKNEKKYIKNAKIIDNINIEHLKIIKKFSKQGKQGIVGILNINNSNKKCVYKISQNINYLIRHESIIMKSLNNLMLYCPHFCKFYKTIKHKVDLNYMKLNNPFQVKTKHPIEIETMLMEYINAPKLSRIIKNKEYNENMIFSCIKQILLALSISQKKFNFTHYDLHSCNILMNKCEKNDVFVYILDDNNYFCLPTFGYYPSIIDFGFSYSNCLENKPIWSSLAHTNVGFTTNQFNPISDIKLFLVTLSDELIEYRKNKKTSMFRKMIKNIFKPLHINWESGWDIYKKNEMDAADHISAAISHIKTKSKLFNKYDHYCTDLLQSLIYLPLENRSLNKLDISYKMFINEFEKIELEIGNTLKSLYIFKCIVSSARNIYSMYINDNTRRNAINMFIDFVYNSISSIAKFCNPKNLNYEKLLCGLYIFAEASETLLYNAIDKKNKKNKKQESKLTINDPIQVYGAVEVNFPDEYVFNSDTRFYIFDSVNQNRKLITDIPEYIIKLLNETDPLMRGSIIYDFLHPIDDSDSDSDSVSSDIVSSVSSVSSDISGDSDLSEISDSD